MRASLGTMPWFATFVTIAAGAWFASPQSALADEGDVSVDLDSTGEIEDLNLEDLLDIPLVESAAKRTQSLFDAPAAVTTITAADIEKKSVDHLPELFRSVPGVFVLQGNANVFNVGMRGINQLANNHVLVLVDGRDLGENSFRGATAWGAAPLHVGDIDRIEILHGPGSTLYGANALSGVINIRTKRPLDHEGVEGTVVSGTYLAPSLRSSGKQYLAMQNGGHGYAAGNWVNEQRTMGLRISGGFNSLGEWGEYSEIAVPRHGTFNYHARASLQWEPSSDLSVFASIDHSLAETDTTVSTASFNDNSLALFYNVQSLVLGAEKRGLWADKLLVKGSVDARRLRVASRVVTQDGRESGDEPDGVDLHAGLQGDLDLLNGRNILSIGGELAYLTAADYFDVKPSARYFAGVLQNELRVSKKPAVLLNVSLRAEQVTASDGDEIEVVYNNLNPRIAVVANFDDEHSLRLVGATAYRTPSAFENFVTVQATNTPVILPNPRLRPTVVTSAELGYRSLWSKKLRADATLFYQQVEDVSSLSRQLATPLRFENVATFRQFGAELFLQVKPTDELALHAHYTFTRTRNKATDEKVENWPMHIGGAAVDYEITKRGRLHADFSYVSKIIPDVLTFRDQTLDFANERVAAQAILNLRYGHAIMNGGAEVFIAARNIISSFRDPDDLRQFPTDIVDPIGGSYLVGIRIKESVK